MHAVHHVVLTALPGLLLLSLLLAIFVLGLVDLLAALTHGVIALCGSEQRSTERQLDGDAAGLLRALWAVPGKVRVGGVTIHVGWIVISLGIAVLAAPLR